MDTTPPLAAIHRLVWISLIAALTAAGAMIAIPIGPVPISLQTFFVILAGLVLGPRAAAYAMLLYIGAGCLGLPVFAGGKAGLAVIFGPTGGYLLGFVPGAMISGLGTARTGKSFLWGVLCCAAGTAVFLLAGALHLALTLHISFAKAFSIGVLPFIPDGIAKCLAAAGTHRFLAARRLLPA